MSTRWEDGDILTSEGPRGLDCDIFDVIDENDSIDVVLYFPSSEWIDADEDDCLEMINEYTFPDWCILSASWEEADGAADPEEGEVAIYAHIQFDMSD